MFNFRIYMDSENFVAKVAFVAIALLVVRQIKKMRRSHTK